MLELATGPTSGFPLIGPLALSIDPGKLLVLKGHPLLVPLGVPSGEYLVRLIALVPGAPVDVAARTLFVP